jgi:DNA-binding CsgD family transcriptional regulator
MFSKQMLFLFLIMLFCLKMASQTSDNPLLEKGWAALVKDQDDTAFRYFFQAYEKAKEEKNQEDEAESLLYLGICSFGSNLEKGLNYATKSLNVYTKLEKRNPEKAIVGRSKCLQLISTIYSRQEKFDESMSISREVVSILKGKKDESGTLGLAYTSLGNMHDMRKQEDSATYFYELALTSFENSNNVAYLPGSYIRIGEVELLNGNRQKSLQYFEKALAISAKTENKQSQVYSLNALGNWFLTEKDINQAELGFKKAYQIATTLSDKSFEIIILESLIKLNEQKKNFSEITKLQKRLLALKEETYSVEREKIVKNLEVQFDVAEKNRKIALVSKENEVANLANWLLLTFIIVLLIALLLGYLYLKNRNKNDRKLLKTKEALVEALEKQRELQETQFKNDLDHKESQLSAITLQMLQKNEFLNDIKKMIEEQQPLPEQQLLKMVNRNLEHNSNWDDFNLYFESINKNFYTRLKQIYPEISSNDLKICALIKLNLSIKEMSSILNISPDSVKTARYRLRKKLQMSGDDNLTNFILSV